MRRFAMFPIGRTCPLLVLVKRLKPLTALSATVYRLGSSMSDHTLGLFNVFEDWNEESVVPHISFDSDSIRMQTADLQVPSPDEIETPGFLPHDSVKSSFL